MTAVLIWSMFAVFGNLALYVFFGFVYCADQASREKNSQGEHVQPLLVYKVDATLALCGVILDALLNCTVWPVLMLDLNPRRLLKPVWRIKSRKIFGWSTPVFHIWFLELVTGRMNSYISDPEQFKFRRYTAEILGAFLNTKNPGHIKGASGQFTRWSEFS